MERRQGDVAPLAERRGGGHSQPGSAGSVALPPAEVGPFPPFPGTWGGPGPLRRVRVPPIWPVLGGPCYPYGSQPGRRTRPRQLPLSGAAAPAALQPLPLRRLRWPLAGGTLSATDCDSSWGCRQTCDGHRSSSTTWSGVPERWPAFRDLGRSHGQNWPWTFRRLWGKLSWPPRTTGWEACACH